MNRSPLLFFKSILHGFVGIAAEVLLAISLIVITLLVCVFWWCIAQ